MYYFYAQLIITSAPIGPRTCNFQPFLDERRTSQATYRRTERVVVWDTSDNMHLLATFRSYSNFNFWKGRYKALIATNEQKRGWWADRKKWYTKILVCERVSVQIDIQPPKNRRMKPIKLSLKVTATRYRVKPLRIQGNMVVDSDRYFYLTAPKSLVVPSP